jgi:quinolinate synthase
VTGKIQKLKKEKNAVILAHYYVPDEVQAIADYVGDSYYLSKKAAESQADIIVFCGVLFMGESAKILNPDKKVLMPKMDADCPMAHMATPESVLDVKSLYDDLAVVCYINSTAEIKTYSDICVTSSNAVKIVKKIPEQNIYFIPDCNLGGYVAEQVPEKNIILHDGYCPIHDCIHVEMVKKIKKTHPKALFLAHPECKTDVLKEADYIGSTSGIINYANLSESEEFIIGTEIGVFYELKNNNPNKKFYPVKENQICFDMKKITLDSVFDVLMHGNNEIHISDEIREKALKPLERMLELGS